MSYMTCLVKFMCLSLFAFSTGVYAISGDEALSGDQLDRVIDFFLISACKLAPVELNVGRAIYEHWTDNNCVKEFSGLLVRQTAYVDSYFNTYIQRHAKLGEWSTLYAQENGIDMPDLIPTPNQWASNFVDTSSTGIPVCKTGDGFSRKAFVCNVKHYSRAVLVTDDTNPLAFLRHNVDCLLCMPQEADYTCPAGTTVKNYVHTINDRVPFTVNKATECTVLCEEGTWMTGSTPITEMSTYHVPRDIDVFPAGKDNYRWISNLFRTHQDKINAIPGLVLPVNGKCFPCNESVRIPHNGKFYPITYMPDDGLIRQMNHRCPGGISPPEKCPLHMVSLVDSRGYTAQCICADSYFRNSTKNGICEICPAGFFCTAELNNIKADNLQQCPSNTYSLDGSSACTVCTQQSCPDPSQSRQACKQVELSVKPTGNLNFQTKDAGCEKCSRCIELGYNLEDAVPCFGIAKIGS